MTPKNPSLPAGNDALRAAAPQLRPSRHGHASDLSPPRLRLLALLRRCGPRGVSELAQHLGMDRTTVLYHARMLEKKRLAYVRTVRGRNYVMLPGQKPPSNTPPSAQRLLDILRASGDQVAYDELCRLTPDMAARTRSHALRWLAARGLIEKTAPAIQLAPGGMHAIRKESHERIRPRAGVA